VVPVAMRFQSPSVSGMLFGLARSRAAGGYIDVVRDSVVIEAGRTE
jgi:hypothetical protein